MKRLLKRTSVSGNTNVTEQKDEKTQTVGTIGERVCSILDKQGMEYEMTSDGRFVIFEYHFMSYFVRCDDDCYFKLGICSCIDENPDLMEWIVLANKVNATYKMAKMVIREDDFLLTAETPIESGTNIEYILRYSLRVLDDALNFIRYNLPGRDNPNAAPMPLEFNAAPISRSNEDENTQDKSRPTIGFTSNRY